MKENFAIDAINHIDNDLVEEYVKEKEHLKRKREKKKRIPWIKWASVAACFCLMIVITVVAVYQIQNKADPNAPIVNLQSPTNAPQFYGDENSIGISSGGSAELSAVGLSITAELVEMLPDTYKFFNDWMQNEFRLLRMETVKLLKGTEMTEEFYYMIPVDFMTDYSIYDRFVIINMAQFGYEWHTIYNETQGQAERLNLPIFGYRVYGYDRLGENFIAYNSNGKRDERLWQSCDAWAEVASKHQLDKYVPMTIREAEQKEKAQSEDIYVHLLKDITGEAKTVLEQITSFENGIYVPMFNSNVHMLGPEVQYHATRYIDGFATNEKVSIWNKEWADAEEDIYQFSKARFDKNDLNALPDLTSGIATIVASYNEGNITPPHIDGYSDMSLCSYGIFGWYAKTENGVLGVIRVTWAYRDKSYDNHYDDAYYIIEYGENECKPITRDDLLERLGEYETTYIYDGDYSEYGKNYAFPTY